MADGPTIESMLQSLAGAGQSPLGIGQTVRLTADALAKMKKSRVRIWDPKEHGEIIGIDSRSGRMQVKWESSVEYVAAVYLEVAAW